MASQWWGQICNLIHCITITQIKIAILLFPKNSVSFKQEERQENYNRMKIGNPQNKLQKCWLKP